VTQRIFDRALIVLPNVKPITLHCLRDTNTSLLAKNGVPLDVISKRLSHASITITAERYLHVYQKRDTQPYRI